MYLLNSDGHGASTVSPASLFESLTILTGEKLFLVACLTLPQLQPYL